MRTQQAVGAGVSQGTTEAENGPEANGARVEPAAISLALAGASRAEADAFLRDQRKLIALQAQELSHELDLRHWSLWVRHASGVLKLTLELGIGLLLVALVAGIGLMVWKASHADGVVIESFGVPPDMAARGLTGEVVAAQVQDRLGVALSGSVASVSETPTVANARADEIKVDIPDTGISLGEVYRFLRTWLGRETMVGGEVFRTPDGLSVTIRIAGTNGATYAGKETELDELLRKAAEHAAEVARPTRYAIFLYRGSKPRRFIEALPILERIANDPAQSPQDRASAFNSLSIIYSWDKQDDRTGLAMLRRAVAVVDSSTFVVARHNLVGAEFWRGHAESALGLVPVALQTLEHPPANLRPTAIADLRSDLRQWSAYLLGDFAEGARLARLEMEVGRPRNRDEYRQETAQFLALEHDGGVRGWMQQMPPLPDPADAASRIETRLTVEAALENWPAVADTEAAEEKAMAQAVDHADLRTVFGVRFRPRLALAKAHLGDVAAAEAIIAPTTADCYPCIRIRAQIAEMAGQPARADFWFARAAHDAPSIPFAYAEWGVTLLGRGQPDAAIEKFKRANEKGPHFADALEGWGEALMAKSQSHLALAKFAEAEKYAPNWGRLHLKWGEALAYSGKKDEAAKQFVRAAQLDLTPSEKSELARMPHV